MPRSRYQKPPELLPEVRRSSAAEPAERHRCAICKAMGAGYVRAFYGREVDRWTCPRCLEDVGQLPIRSA